MAITKIQSESLNLADTYAFTGTVTGAGDTNPLSHFSYWKAGNFNHSGSASTLMTGFTQQHSTTAVLGHSSGTFSFPSTGYYLITCNSNMYTYPGADARNVQIQIHTTSNNSTYSSQNSGEAFIRDVGDATHTSGCFTYMMDITDTTNQKFRIYAYSATTPANTLSFTGTHLTVARVGDT